MADMVRVVLGDDFYRGECYREDPRGDYEVPREQVQRWSAAVEAYQAMQSEIAALIEAEQRRRREALARENREARRRGESTARAVRGTFSNGGA